MTTVVDASVVLAWLQDEPGADEAEPLLMEGVIGAANWSEVLQKVRQHGAPAGVVARLLASFGLTVVDVTQADAENAAALWQQGTLLSLADRLCLALGMRADYPVATADAAWTAIQGGPEVILVRWVEQQATEIPRTMGGVAPRELSAHGITRYEQLTEMSEKDLLAIHGVGPKAIGILREELRARGLAFKDGWASR